MSYFELIYYIVYRKITYAPLDISCACMPHIGARLLASQLYNLLLIHVQFVIRTSQPFGRKSVYIRCLFLFKIYAQPIFYRCQFHQDFEIQFIHNYNKIKKSSKNLKPKKNYFIKVIPFYVYLTFTQCLL